MQIEIDERGGRERERERGSNEDRGRGVSGRERM
jgi:hypothetical protein